MALIESCSGISKAFGSRVLFEGGIRLDRLLETGFGDPGLHEIDHLDAGVTEEGSQLPEFARAARCENPGASGCQSPSALRWRASNS